LLKNILYNKANARFHTNPTTKPTTGKSTQMREFTPSPDSVNPQRADKVANNKAATQTHTTAPKRIFPKNDQAVTSFGALSNIEMSGFFKFFCPCIELDQTCVLPIGEISHKLEFNSFIVG
jgi:hypothetical protein